jgi:adenylylsulfate kinase
MVIWLIGMSGAGKTTIAREVYRQWRVVSPATVLVDGDEIREIFRHESADAYTLEGRRQNANRIHELCAWLDRQEINVVCSILSIFEETRARNRQRYSRYFETYVSVPLETLFERDNKGLYRAAREGRMKNVVGVDIRFEEPTRPDLVITNGPKMVVPAEAGRQVLKAAGVEA